jgi:hypothetical protein
MKSSSKDRFLMCIDNSGNEASLQVGKVYRAVATEKISRDHGLVRVIDEEQEDYLYSEDQFVEVRLPRAGKEALLRANSAS